MKYPSDWRRSVHGTAPSKNLNKLLTELGVPLSHVGANHALAVCDRSFMVPQAEALATAAATATGTNYADPGRARPARRLRR